MREFSPNTFGGIEQARQELPIAAPARQIELEYLQPATTEAPAQWVTEWVAEKRLEMPRGLRIRWTRGRDVQTATFLLPMTKDPQIQR